VPTPGGIGTPAFGPGHRVIRLTATDLVVEAGDDRTRTPLAGATLRALAAAAGADLAADLDLGREPPPLGDVDRPVTLHPAVVEALAAWFALGWAIVDRVAATDPTVRSCTRAQLWPEHLDAAATATYGAGDDDRANVGASAGDALHAEPYLYVGPWGAGRPGADGYWNAPFGALIGRDELLAADDPVAAGAAFVADGLARLA
jgi:hypothetical protein